MAKRKLKMHRFIFELPERDYLNLQRVACAEERSAAWFVRKFVAAGVSANLERLSRDGTDLEQYIDGVE